MEEKDAIVAVTFPKRTELPGAISDLIGFPATEPSSERDQKRSFVNLTVGNSLDNPLLHWIHRNFVKIGFLQASLHSYFDGGA